MKRLGFLLLACCAPAMAADPAQGVLDCMRANVPTAVRLQSIELSVFDRGGGSRVLKGRLYAQRQENGPGPGLLHANLRIEQPEHLAGAAYLVRETDDYLRDGMFLYLPSVRRVRRVTGSFADGALLGTSFSYYDFKQLANAFGDLSAEPGAPEVLDGRPMHTLTFTALPGVETRYSRVRAWIDQETCVALKAEFYEGQNLRKQLSAPAASLRQTGKHWYAGEVEMREPVEGTRTLLRLGEVRSDTKLPGRYFDPTAFYLGN